MEATITKNGLVYSVDMKTIYYADDSGEFRGTIPNGVERIEDEAFSCCSVEKIYIPDSVTSVGSNLFENATSLKSVRLPSGLKKLSPYMFAGCSGLEQIEMPFEIESFEEGLFAGCSSLKEIPFRAGLKELPNYVFSGCSELRSLILPDTIEKICEGAVSDCEKLTTLVLPASLKEIEEGAFEGCYSLSHIRLNGENPYFRVDDAESCLYRKNMDGTETLILHLEGNSLSEVPTFHEVDENAPVSILDFNEEDDIAEDDSDIILTQEELDKVCPRTEDSSEDKIEKYATPISQRDVSEESFSENIDVSDRLAEIMGQSSVSTSDEISADEIPYATAEELEAGRLAPSEKTVTTEEISDYSECSESEEEISQDEVVECEEVTSCEATEEVPSGNDDMSSRLAEIMGQSSVSTSDEISADEIPYATAEELETGYLAPSEKTVTTEETSDEAECTESEEVASCEATEEVPSGNDDMSSRLAEIMGQSSASTSDDISADEIPYATAEELEAGCLAPREEPVTTEEISDEVEYSECSESEEVASCEATEEIPSENDDVSDRLAEIMGQSSVSTSDDISADEIPYATAEELEAGCLAPSEETVTTEETSDYSECTESEEVASCEATEEIPSENDDVSDRLAEIMGQSSVSTSDEISADEIPYATAEELDAGCLAPSKETVATEEISDEAEYSECTESEEVASEEINEETNIVENTENTETGGKLLEAELTDNMDEFENTEIIENMELAENTEVCEVTECAEVTSDVAEYEEVFFEMDEGEYSSCIEDYFFGIGRYETIALDTSCDEQKTLYVFAKTLNAEHNFSSKLINCCHRLAKVHNYSEVKLLSNPQFIEENREKFSEFMKEKDVIYACSVSSLSLMSDDEKDLCGLLGIALDREGLIAQAKTASDKNAPFIKLLIQDNID